MALVDVERPTPIVGDISGSRPDKKLFCFSLRGFPSATKLICPVAAASFFPESRACVSKLPSWAGNHWFSRNF